MSLGRQRWVLRFEEGTAEQRALLGGKGAGLAEMTRIGLPVPSGFTITTEACIAYNRGGKAFPAGLEDELWEQLAELERRTGKTLGDPAAPLLVSVRSGAAISMPGMMDTVLNLGLNDATAEGLAAATGDERFARDCYRRFIQMFGNVVLGLEHQRFEAVLEQVKESRGVRQDHELTADALRELLWSYKDLVRRERGSAFPQDPREQLLMAVRAVFDSWDNPRAVTYRRIHAIPDDLGTAVNIQAMVFGNWSGDSGTGVLFTRNPSTGEKVLFGEYLTNAQGEDVVAGIRTPRPIAQLEAELPEVYRQIRETCELLEAHYRDVQDIEFTIERGRLYLLQTRTGKRSAAAAVRIANDLVREGKIDRRTALERVTPEQIDQLLHRHVDPQAPVEVLAQGLPASPGAACGVVVFDADTAAARAERGEAVILVRPETTPDDIHGIVAAQGVLTSRGGMTCHAAIVARGMGKPCVVGCEEVAIDLGRRTFSVRGQEFAEGELLSIDGGTGRVMRGRVPLVEPELSDDFRQLLAWADEEKRLGVRANADTPEDAARARAFGAAGVGLCRTEHMFMAQERLPVMQEMILAETEEERRAALERLLPMQEEDFRGILAAMEGFPVTIRLLDPPLHEFLPRQDQLAQEIAAARAAGRREEMERLERLRHKAHSLAEFNPMLGFRGCRLGIVYPEIYEMQARAIFQATAHLVRQGRQVIPEVMIPLVGDPRELAAMRDLVRRVHAAVCAETGLELPCKVGTMLEVPRACLLAERIAEHADFFSFGTNDLTQTVFGFSRDDAEGKFLRVYLEDKILSDNPFAVLDREGVGRLMEAAVGAGRRRKPELKMGICGEHGGEPSSIAFCHRIGLSYVSCSPYRVPVARLAAAQAALREGSD